MKGIFPRTLLAAGGLAAGLLCGQMRLDGPVRDFHYPVFGESGYRVWDLRGAEGEQVSDRVLDVWELDLQVYDGTEKQRRETVLTSPQARVFLEEQRAEGPSALRIEGPGYTITGRNWSWDGRGDTVVVREDARVVYDTSLGDILR